MKLTKQQLRAIITETLNNTDPPPEFFGDNYGSSQNEPCPECGGENTEHDEMPSMMGYGSDTSLTCHDCKKSFAMNPFTGAYGKGSSIKEATTNEALDTVDLSGGWARLAGDALLDVLDDQALKERVANDIDMRSSELGDDSFYPGRVEDIESTAVNAAKKIFADRQFQEGLELFVEQVISRALRRGF